MDNKYLEHALVMLDKVEGRVQAEFSALSRAQINWKPDAKSWSIAECLDHLKVTNELYSTVFEDLKNNSLKRPLLAGLPGWSGFCTRQVEKSVDPETKRKVKTLKVFQPTASDYARTIIEAFTNSIHQLKTYFHEIDGYEDHDKIKFASPASAMVILDLESAVGILWKHCVRHLNQAHRLTVMPGFPEE